MKIATFNINGINRRLPNLLAWLAEAAQDVVCLQELKATDRQFPRTAIAAAGYGAAFVGEASWNGVAILARDVEPVVTQTSLPGDATDTQARYIEAAVNGVVIASLYAPNGNPQPGPKFDYKLAWLARLYAHAAELLASRLPIILAGGSSIVPGRRATSTGRPPIATMRWCSLPPAPPSPRCSRKAGPTPCASCIPTCPTSTPSGTTCGTAGPAMPGCASIICC